MSLRNFLNENQLFAFALCLYKKINYNDFNHQKIYNNIKRSNALARSFLSSYIAANKMKERKFFVNVPV